MTQDLPPPPQQLRPGYYQNLFLVASFVLWPTWPILIIRSPWHNGILSGGVAWAYLICGSVLVFKSIQGGLWDLIVLMLPPGLVLTFALQVFWESYKRQELRPYLPVSAGGETTHTEPGTRKKGVTSASTPRSRQRRRSRSGRSPRR